MTERYLNKVNYAVSKTALSSDTVYLSTSDYKKIKILYGENNTENVVSPISSVYSNELNTTPASSYMYGLVGRLPGLNVNQLSGFRTPLTASLTSLDIFSIFYFIKF